MDEKVLNRLRNMCSRREYCTGDILDKLRDREDADEIVESLKKDGYLSDSRFAGAYARDKSSLSGWGRIKISHGLASKGISAQDIGQALLSIDENRAWDKLVRTMTTKYSSIKDDPEWKLKLIRFALSRGYEYDEVKKALDEILRTIS